MADWLMPDKVFAHFYDLTPSFLVSEGVKALLIDIDNTLAPYEVAEPDERILSWFSELSKHGIKATLVSNNGRERVELFNKSLGLPVYFKSGKPYAKNLKRAMAKMGSDATNTAVLGDQLLTDVAAGKHIGLRAYLVPPIKDRTSAFFRFKRALEVPKMKKYVRLHRDDKTASASCDFWINRRYRLK